MGADLPTRPRLATLQQVTPVAPQDPAAIQKLAKAKAKAYKELQARQHRKMLLDQMTNDVQQQRNMMGKGTKKKIVDEDGKVTFKWKPERKR
eukprot:TRINITY_DN11743_c0_g1_i3.p1 TRINITY_DN11743_c0_g1~~TRINITY_DN11743_c0_g1_i3.p1  ORF type:complete len:100 (-),score=40.02 TRINITY_DN11743_c0_g1_i3:15-290(-)